MLAFFEPQLLRAFAGIATSTADSHIKFLLEGPIIIEVLYSWF